LLCLAAALAGCAATGNAGTLYTFGADFISLGGSGAPDILNSMDPASAASVAAGLPPVGGGDLGFNGGLVAFGSLLYGIGNDSNGFATLYSMGTDGQNLTAVGSAFNTSGDATGIAFQNGLAAVGSAFYAIGEDESLYEIGSGSANLIQPLNTFGGTYAGLAWDPALQVFYAVVANGTDQGNTGDFLVQFALSGSVSIVADLTSLGGTQAGTHFGGLADAGGGILYDIYTNPATFTGVLEQINLNGSPSATTLYDTNIPLAQNAGLATFTPEPASGAVVGAALILLCGVVRRFGSGKRQF
jgi:hypothetical protein